ncbi:hypothetical protein PGTUg99_021346 [Puccinia graminis f. sp. tritici]|uniref:Uncharacterized protein n=1 Tax=Puccinia graminis f. sp. tritici TaxID=56615 RepID=A0A5B0Q8G3_PUCGR|nr:hypothetical protein PGTUg99_021346 [Puccinia graminis f. sp. tritici]
MKYQMITDLLLRYLASTLYLASTHADRGEKILHVSRSIRGLPGLALAMLHFLDDYLSRYFRRLSCSLSDFYQSSSIQPSSILFLTRHRNAFYAACKPAIALISCATFCCWAFIWHVNQVVTPHRRVFLCALCTTSLSILIEAFSPTFLLANDEPE